MTMNRRSMLRSSLMPVAGLMGLPSISQAVQQAANEYRRPKLRVTDVRTAELRGHGYQLQVRVYTDQGIFGHGENTDASEGTAPLVRNMGRQLLNADPLNIEAYFERVRTSGVFAGAQGGQYVCALTAIEMALWDLAGKALGIPVYQLMGGKVRNRVRILCDSGLAPMERGNPRSIAKIKEIAEMGFTAMKIDIDEAGDPARFDRVNWTASNGEIDHMLDKIAFVRESMPKNNMDLAVDMHARYDLHTAKRVASEVEKFRLMWLEEPVPAENVDAMRDVRESCHTPICCGENRYLRAGFRELLEKRAVDVITPDLSKCGGLLEGRKIADMAHTYYIPFAPHDVTSPIGSMATAHVNAAVPNFLVQEWHWIDNLADWKNWVKEGEIIDKGFITLPDRPGIGVEMNEEYAKKNQIAGTPWFEPTPQRNMVGPGGQRPGGQGGAATPAAPGR